MIQILSLGEIDTLSRHAVRGAGYSWGLAEDTGRSVRWLAENNLAGVEALAMLLRSLEAGVKVFRPRQIDGRWQSSELLCPIYCSSIINDYGRQLLKDGKLRFDCVSYPLLVLPQVVHLVKAYDYPVDFFIDNLKIECNKQGGIGLQGGHEQNFPVRASIICKPSQTSKNNEKAPLFYKTHAIQRLAISNDIFETLKYFAYKTYAPATEQSRLKGAGAGLTDND